MDFCSLSQPVALPLAAGSEKRGARAEDSAYQ